MQRDVLTLTRGDVTERAKYIAQIIRLDRQAHYIAQADPIHVYGIPRGGVFAAQAILWALNRHSSMFEMVYDPAEADIIVDDLVDSGKTRERHAVMYPGADFYALYDKSQSAEIHDYWVVFPWERDEQGSAEDFTLRLLQYIGEDVKRDGLKDTPARVSRAWKTWTDGYDKKVEDIIKTFDGVTEQSHELILVRDIQFYSHCEHHLAPFFGTADIAYIPNANGKILGLSKLSRVLDVFAHRLQVQERLTTQVAEALMKGLDAKGVAVRVRARHLCMESRGVRKPGSETVTQALRGVFFDDPRARAEFMGLVK